MAIDKYFLKPDSEKYISEAKPGNSVEFFVDNRKLFKSMFKDLKIADGEEDFVYIINWWCDVDIPLAYHPNFLLRDVLSLISKEKNNQSSIQGAQICAMLWRHKSQWDFSALPTPVPLQLLPTGLSIRPPSLIGDDVLASINSKAAKHINSCPSNSKAVIDGLHRLFGSHHQKLLVVKNRNGLIAYVGSADFNADRLFPKGDDRAINPPTTKGAPLEDISLRIEGQASEDVLKTFVDRWKLHPEVKNHPLRGATYSAPKTVGDATAQVTHTYGKKYPFKNAIRSSADAILKIIGQARDYIYFEDQYLIGTEELAKALRDRLTTNVTLSIIGVMAPLEVADLPWLVWKRSDFWRPLIDKYASRIKLFEMTNRFKSKSGDGSYLHAKLTIVDDEVAAIGSVNCSNRSWYHDSEIQITLSGNASDNEKPQGLAARLRLGRWTRHLGINKHELLNYRHAIGKWGNLPRTALVEQWTPPPLWKQRLALPPLPLPPPLPPISPALLYKVLYEVVFDPK